MTDLRLRQFVDDDVGGSFWWTRDGTIVRWSLFGGLLFLLFGYMAIGYWHARRRIRNGLPPLAYHRWLLSREQRAQFDPSYRLNHQDFYYSQYPDQYGMHPVPPPVYDPNAPLPPTYQPPAGGTKVDPSQWRQGPTRRPTVGEPSPEYEAPPGPPRAAALHANQTGSSSSSNNPYRP